MKNYSIEILISNGLLVVGAVVCMNLAGCDSMTTFFDPVEPVHEDYPDSTTYNPLPSTPGSPSSGPGCPAISNSFVSDKDKFIAHFNRASCAQIQYCIKPEFWKSLPQVSYIPGIDLVIVFDVTGSMNPYIQAMIKNMQQLIANLNALSPSLRLGLVKYQDFADKGGGKSDVPFKVVSQLTTDTALVSLALSKLTAGGGGDIPESLATAVKATIDGKGLGSYFGPSDMQWSTDASRIKIVLGISDASNRATNLPAGAPTLAETAALLKEKGILFLGIGRKNAPGTPVNATWSYADLATLATESGALVSAPGIDLDGDLVANTFGEAKTGEPAILLMDSSGNLVGAPTSSNPIKILADAITQMVKRVQPYKVDLKVLANGRSYSPDVNTLAIPPDYAKEICFSDVKFQMVSSFDSSTCAANSPVEVSALEELTATNVGADYVKAKLQVSDSCGALPEPTPVETPPPSEGDLPGGGGSVGV
ncbi:MAG: VWA domain-containing protein [Xanthomonadaceae bacterium]|nr:VWA domain-containing protein [Xanthomonadaceae bacterium]